MDWSYCLSYFTPLTNWYPYAAPLWTFHEVCKQRVRRVGKKTSSKTMTISDIPSIVNQLLSSPLTPNNMESAFLMPEYGRLTQTCLLTSFSRFLLWLTVHFKIIKSFKYLDSSHSNLDVSSQPSTPGLTQIDCLQKAICAMIVLFKSSLSRSGSA
jgi:uncharacterized membrane protein